MENKFPTEVIDLPSQGYFYASDNPLSSGKLELKYMTAKEEDILTSKNLIQRGVVIDKLLESLIVTPIKYSELLSGDKVAIIIASRILAYGKDYAVEISCDSCKHKFETAVDLTTLTNREIDVNLCKKGERTLNFELPYSKINLIVKLLNHEDETNIEAELKGLKKISAQDGIDRELTTRLRHIIISVNGDSKRETINNFVMNELLSRDLLELKKFMRKVTPDVDSNVTCDCPNCGNSLVFDLPININFFWPSGRE